MKSSARAKLRERVESWCKSALVHDTGPTPPMNAATVDRLTPRSHGGSNELANLAIACRACNAARGAIRPRQWAEWVAGPGAEWAAEDPGWRGRPEITGRQRHAWSFPSQRAKHRKASAPFVHVRSR